ncbi:MAG: retropepsin-like domain-containing protein [Saprospiraceae bacterium]|nr:retropepsin-like domain-containing protein [Saprospiraceae bacterium]
MKKLLLSCIILNIFTFSSCSQNITTSKENRQNANSIEIPFKLDVNRLIVKGKINGKGEFSFIFDTGAQGVVLSDSLSDALDLKGEGFSAIGSPNNPNAIQAKNIDIPLFTINGFESRNEEAVAVDFKKVFHGSRHDGIFGLSTFKGHLVTINYPESKLIITKGELNENDPDIIKIDLSRILALSGKLNEKEIPIHFDSGSPSFITLPIEWKPDLLLKSEPVLFAKGKTASGEVELYKATLSGKIEIGNIIIIDPDILLKTGGFPAANFGYEFLKNYLLTIDMVNERLRMMPFEKATLANNETQNNNLLVVNDCNKYAGTYGNRKVTCENGALYSQRIISEKDQEPGRQAVAPKLKLLPDGNDEFKIEQFPNGRIKFVKDSSGNIIEMQVLNPQGEWEKSKRTS